MKKLLQKHISEPYAMIVLAVLLFGFVMTGLIPIGNGYIINPECTENGRFIANTGNTCGGFSLFGMDHFLFHPQVTIPVGILLLVLESFGWAALLFSGALLFHLLKDLEFKRNPFKGKAAQRTWLSILAGILLLIHFSASPVRSKLLPSAEPLCSSQSATCAPCPGVRPALVTAPVNQDYGWPFHIVQKTFVEDECGNQQVLVRSRIDILAFAYNLAFWSILSYAVLHWLGSRPRLLDAEKA